MGSLTMNECEFISERELHRFEGPAVRRVLLLADLSHPNQVVNGYIQAFRDHSLHDVTLADPNRVKPLSARAPMVERLPCDLVIIHYSTYVLDRASLPANWFEALARFDGPIIQIVQDEYRAVNAMVAAWEQLGVTVVLSSLTVDNARTVYGASERALSPRMIVSCLPGYVLDRYLSVQAPPLTARHLDVVYRGRVVEHFAGAQHAIKSDVVSLLLNSPHFRDFHLDIGVQEEDRIYGSRWMNLLCGSRTSLATEGGAGRFQLDNHRSISVDHRSITPKCFEVISSGAALVAVPGTYRGILEANEHYFPLHADGSNLQEVATFIRDDTAIERMALRAYEGVIASGQYLMRDFVGRIDSLVDDLVCGSSTDISGALESPVLAQSLGDMAVEAADLGDYAAAGYLWDQAAQELFGRAGSDGFSQWLEMAVVNGIQAVHFYGLAGNRLDRARELLDACDEALERFPDKPVGFITKLQVARANVNNADSSR